MPNFQNYLKSVKSEISECSEADLKAVLETQGDPTTVIDVREEDEYIQGFIPGAKWIPRGFLEIRIENQVPKKERPVILYCAGGTRSALAARSLKELGYSNVKSLAGGFSAWKRAGFKAEVPIVMSQEQKVQEQRVQARYAPISG